MCADEDQRDNVSRMIGRLLRGNKLMVMNPDTIAKEMKKGGPIQFVKDDPVPLAMDKLFEDRKKHALEVADKLIRCPIPEPLLIYFYDQIRACILFKLHSIAITMCGTMVECILKYCSYVVESNGSNVYDSVLWDTFEKDDFGKSIERALKNGLLDDKTKQSYINFKNNFRNPYAHFNLQKITKDVSFPEVEVINTNTRESKIETISTAHSPIFQMLALESMDEDRVVEVFGFADRLVQHLFVVLSKIEWKK